MRIIKLTRGEVVVVDDDDYKELSKYHWYCMITKDGHRYAVRSEGNKKVLMHRQLMSFPELYVDHINGNGLDDQRSNLRIATNSINQFNRKLLPTNKSGFRGVHLHKKSGKWEAQIRVNQKNVHLGLFTDPVSASEAYKKARAELVGI